MFNYTIFGDFFLPTMHNFRDQELVNDIMSFIVSIKSYHGRLM